MNDGLSIDTKNKFIFPLMTELHDPKEKVFYIPTVSTKL